MNRTAGTWALLVTFLVLGHSLVKAELQCAPTGVDVQFPENDGFFASELTAWSRTTRSRYTEGHGDCPDVTVPGYEGFPTKRCQYDNADAGSGVFPSLHAEVVLLSPSARQLAAWTIHACRTNGATDSSMAKCLNKLRNQIINSNGAQFPVVGSVVESYCNSSTKSGPCEKLNKDDPARKPRNTWFRDGISVDYKAAQGVSWDETAYPKTTFDAVFDTQKSDPNINVTYDVARVAGAQRDQWIKWRKHVSKPEMPNGLTGTVNGGGWRVVSAEVHKAACRSASSELFDAVVWNNPGWTRP